MVLKVTIRHVLIHNGSVIRASTQHHHNVRVMNAAQEAYLEVSIKDDIRVFPKLTPTLKLVPPFIYNF